MNSGLGAIDWAVVAAIVGILGAIGRVLVKLIDRLNAAEGKADTAEKTAQSAAVALAAKGLELERLEADLVNHRVSVARDYVSKDTLQSLETRIVDAINRLGDRLDKILQAR